MNTLKEKLLSLGTFDDNEYLDFYCVLIESNRKTKQEKYKTQKHHFIPVAYYQYKYDIHTRRDAEKYSDTDENNFKINLLYKDHVLAHYYLYHCCNDEYLKSSNRDCFVLMCGRISISDITELDLDKVQKIYEEYAIKDSQRMRNNKINKNRKYSEEEKLNISIRMKQKVKDNVWCNPMSDRKNVEKMRKTLKKKYADGSFIGRRGSRHTEEAKKKMSEHNCMKKQEYRDNLSKKFKGRIPWNKGKIGVQRSSIKGKKAIYKNGIKKYSSITELDKYLADGWKLFKNKNS